MDCKLGCVALPPVAVPHYHIAHAAQRTPSLLVLITPTLSACRSHPHHRIAPSSAHPQVDLLESTSIARALANKNKYELVANQEIVGLGLANFAGAAFHCYSTTGSFSRSAVNNESGG